MSVNLEKSVRITRPTTQVIARSTTVLGKPVEAGDTVEFWDGFSYARYTVTKHDMVKVDRYRNRAAKQRDHRQAEMARQDLLAERELRRARRDEAARRLAAANDAIRMIAQAGN